MIVTRWADPRPEPVQFTNPDARQIQPPLFHLNDHIAPDPPAEPEIVRRIAVALVETMAGYRPHHFLWSWTTPIVRRRVERYRESYAGRISNPKLRLVSGLNKCEVVALFRLNDRNAFATITLELHNDRWSATHIDLVAPQRPLALAS